jgi:hypothetical protein
MNEQWSDEYARMLDDCEKRESKLSDWEIGFVDSLGMRIAAGKTPTPKQIETLDTIWERVTA